MIVTITVKTLDRKHGSLFIDAFNDWARYPDIDALMARTDDTPSGDPESDYCITYEEAA